MPHKILRLVPKRADPETITELRSLLSRAERGEAIGFLAVVHHPNETMSCIGTGSLTRNRVMGLGALHLLKERLIA